MLPFVLLALNLLPAVIVGGVLAFAGLDELPIGYAEYASTTQVLLGIFVAAQAPVLFSRDLRHGTISLYLARPLRSSTYALSRWTSLLGATLVFLLLPILILYAVALLGELDVGEQTRRPASRSGSPCCSPSRSPASPGSSRRGRPVAGSPSWPPSPCSSSRNGIVTAIQGISGEEGRPRGRRGRRPVLAVLALPRADGRLDRRRRPRPRRRRRGMELAYVGVFVGLSAACLAALRVALPAGGDGMSVLSLDQTSRWYGNVVAVNGISMTVRPGVTGLLGPNGAGKTTIIALMAGFLAPSAGTVTLDGEPVWRRTDAYRTIGLVPERELSFGYLTGRQFVLANAELHGLDDPGAATERALDVVEMAEPAGRRIGTYSKGMRQRVKLASALVHDPAVLLLDEPFNGVDPRQRLHLMALLRRMGGEGRTVLFSSHILEEVEQVARQIEVVVSGRHAASGDFGQIRRLMTDRPVQYVVVADDDRRLAASLIAEPSVVAVSLRARRRGRRLGLRLRRLRGAAAAGGARARHPDPRADAHRRVARERLRLPGGRLSDEPHPAAPVDPGALRTPTRRRARAHRRRPARAGRVRAAAHRRRGRARGRGRARLHPGPARSSPCSPRPPCSAPRSTTARSSTCSPSR